MAARPIIESGVLGQGEEQHLLLQVGGVLGQGEEQHLLQQVGGVLGQGEKQHLLQHVTNKLSLLFSYLF